MEVFPWLPLNSQKFLCIDKSTSVFEFLFVLLITLIIISRFCPCCSFKVLLESYPYQSKLLCYDHACNYRNGLPCFSLYIIVLNFRSL